MLFISECDIVQSGDNMNNLKKLRQTHNLSQTAFAKMLGVAQNTVSNWENGNRFIDNETLKRISSMFDVSIDYLLGQESKKENPIFSSGKKGIKIPVLGEVRAGIPVEAVQDIIDYEEITEDMASLGSYFGLQIKGSSMEPKFSDGDVVIVKKQPTAETGDIVIAMVNGDEATVKKFKRMDNGIMLLPTNPNFEAMFYTNEEVEKKPITILGKVVELRAKF